MQSLCLSSPIAVKREGYVSDAFNMNSLQSSLGFSLCSMPRKHQKISTSMTNFSELDVDPICSLSSFKDASNFDSLDLSCMLKKDRRSSLTSFFSISYFDKFDHASSSASKLGPFGCEGVEAVGSMDFDNEERKLDDVSDTSSDGKHNTFESGDDLEELVVVQQEFGDIEFAKLNTAGLTGLKQENKIEEDYFTPVELEELGGFMEHMDKFETGSDIDEIDYEHLDFVPLKPSSSQQSGSSENSSESVSMHVSKGKPISRVSDSIALNRPKRKGRGRPRKYLSDSSDSAPSTPTKSILGSISSQKVGGPSTTKRSQRISDGQLRESLHDSYVESVYSSSYASLSRQKRKYTRKNNKDEQLYSQPSSNQATTSNSTGLQVTSSRHSSYPLSDSLRNKSTTQGGMSRGHTRHSEGSKLRKRKGYVGAYSPEARRILLQKYLEKRKKRVWTKKIKYEVRKSFADSRLRVKGRFIKKEDEDLLRENLMIAF